MYYLNKSYSENEVIKEYDQQVYEKEVENYPAFHFLERLQQDQIFWTPDAQHYFLLREMYDYEVGGPIRQAIGCVCFGASFNTWIDWNHWKKFVVHIDWLCTYNEWRGIGTLSVMSKYLQEAAEDSGVFLFGHVRPFTIDLPKLCNAEEIEIWLNTDKIESEYVSLKKEKKQAKKLYQKYKEYGFCNFDGIGIDFNNRWWRNTCFGYRSSQIKSDQINSFLDDHLFC